MLWHDSLSVLQHHNYKMGLVSCANEQDLQHIVPDQFWNGFSLSTLLCHQSSVGAVHFQWFYLGRLVLCLQSLGGPSSQITNLESPVMILPGVSAAEMTKKVKTTATVGVGQYWVRERISLLVTKSDQCTFRNQDVPEVLIILCIVVTTALVWALLILFVSI